MSIRIQHIQKDWHSLPRIYAKREFPRPQASIQMRYPRLELTLLKRISIERVLRIGLWVEPTTLADAVVHIVP